MIMRLNLTIVSYPLNDNLVSQWVSKRIRTGNGKHRFPCWGAPLLFDAETQLGSTHSLPAVGDLNREDVVPCGEVGAVGGDALGGDASLIANALGDVDPHPAIEDFQAVWIGLGSGFGNETNDDVSMGFLRSRFLG